jgi:uncharacterized protein (DUF885 family)
MPVRNLGSTLRIALFVSVVLLSAGCGSGGGQDEKFEKLSSAFCEEYFRLNPVLATWAGEHRYDHQLDDVSREGIASRLATLGTYLARVRDIDWSRLSPDNRIDAEILANGIELDMLTIEGMRSFEANPMVYTDLLGSSINLLITRDFGPLDERLDAAADRLEAFPRVIDQAIANLSNPPKPCTEMAISQNRALTAFVENDLMKVAEALPRKSKKLEKAAGPALEALDRFQLFLEKDLINRSLGDSRLGDALYRRLIGHVLQSDMSSEEIVAAAYAEIDRVHDDMYELAAPLFAEMTGTEPGTHPARAARMEIIRKVLGKIADDHPGAVGLLDACKAAYAEASAFVREKGIVPIPDEPFEIIWTPEYARGISLTALAAPGPLDREVKYYFMVSPVPLEFDRKQTESYLREYNSEMIRLVTIHEAMPGHYVQLAYANRNPSIVRAICTNTAFIEGWAVYCMEFMNELGFRDGDPRFMLQWNKYYLRVLINAIIDSGMHREGMTESEAVALLTEDGFQEEAEASIKWRRVGLNPGYLSTYFVGYLEMRALRIEAEARWGGQFELGEFNEKLLSLGALPPRLARRALLGE